tara:strand:+ start:1395 stop:3053 length:1659 start_codon:yes stop_codon:yes gene_type:complete
MKITFYSPNSYLISHSIPETILISELIKQGHEIHRIFCDGLFESMCPSISSSGYSNKSNSSFRKDICSKCIKVSNGFENINGVKYYYISKYLSKEKKRKVDSYIFNLNYKDFSFKGDYFVSKKLKMKALYLTILKYKINNIKLSRENFKFYREKLKNSLYSLYAAQELKKIIATDLLFIYSPQYEINNFFYEGFKFKNLKTYFIEGSDNIFYKHSALRVWSWDKYKLESPVKENFKNYKIENFPMEAKNKSLKHIKELLRAKNMNVYSLPSKGKKIKFRNGFNLNKFKKVFLLSTSSYDEAYAANIIGAFPDYKIKSNVFKNQIEWIRYTVNFFKKNKNYGLIIRIHPREFLNKREGKISSHYYELLKVLDHNKKSENIYLNYPQEGISIYDLFNVIDVTLSSWSITAIESLCFGKVVITYDNKLTNYPNNLVITGNSVNEYENNLNKIINNKLDLKDKIYYKKMGLNWFIINHYLNNIYFQFSGIFFSFLIIIIKISLKINLNFLIKKSILLNVKILKLDSFSRVRFLDLVNNKLNHLLSKKILLNKKFLK